MDARRAILLAVLGVVLGIAARSFAPFSFASAGATLLVSIALAALWRLGALRSGPFCLWLAFLVAGVAFGIGYYNLREIPAFRALSYFSEGTRHVRGIIIEEPDVRTSFVRLTVKITSERVEDAWQRTPETKALFMTDRYPEFAYGEEIEARGFLRRPRSGAEFDWRAHLAKDNILYEMFYPYIQRTGSGGGTWHKRLLFALKARYLAALGKVLPEPQSAFLGGLTVGARQSIPEDLQDDFRTTGVMHLIVLSGYNITVVADSILRFLSAVGVRRAFALGGGALSIAAFAVMTGGSATIVRAAIMALLVLFARATGRVYTVTAALFAAGIIMLLANPRLLRFDPSFQLSFLATAGLIYIAPVVERRLGFLPKRFGIRQNAASTIAAQIAVYPLLLFLTGELSVVSPLVNVLILLFVPVTMLFGFLAGGLGMISSIAALPFAWIVNALLRYELTAVSLFAPMPFASVSLGKVPWVVMALLYAGLFCVVSLFGRKQENVQGSIVET